LPPSENSIGVEGEVGARGRFAGVIFESELVGSIGEFKVAYTNGKGEGYIRWSFNKSRISHQLQIGRVGARLEAFSDNYGRFSIVVGP